MPGPAQGHLPPEPVRCLSCGSLHVYPAEVETADGRVLARRCLDCGWEDRETATEPAEPVRPPRRHESGSRRTSLAPLVEAVAQGAGGLLDRRFWGRRLA